MLNRLLTTHWTHHCGRYGHLLPYIGVRSGFLRLELLSFLGSSCSLFSPIWLSSSMINSPSTMGVILYARMWRRRQSPNWNLLVMSSRMSLIPSWKILEDLRGLVYIIYKENFSDELWSEWRADADIDDRGIECWILVFNILLKWIDKLDELWNNPNTIVQI